MIETRRLTTRREFLDDLSRISLSAIAAPAFSPYIFNFEKKIYNGIADLRKLLEEFDEHVKGAESYSRTRGYDKILGDDEIRNQIAVWKSFERKLSEATKRKSIDDAVATMAVDPRFLAEADALNFVVGEPDEYNLRTTLYRTILLLENVGEKGFLFLRTDLKEIAKRVGDGRDEGWMIKIFAAITDYLRSFSGYNPTVDQEKVKELKDLVRRGDTLAIKLLQNETSANNPHNTMYNSVIAENTDELEAFKRKVKNAKKYMDEVDKSAEKLKDWYEKGKGRSPEFGLTELSGKVINEDPTFSFVAYLILADNMRRTKLSSKNKDEILSHYNKSLLIYDEKEAKQRWYTSTLGTRAELEKYIEKIKVELDRL